MILCIVKRCLWTTNSIDRLYDHLRRHHQQITIYTCNYENCTRSYNVRASFFRHFKQHLNNNDDHRNINLDVPLNVSQDSMNECNTNKSERNEAQPSASRLNNNEVSDFDIEIPAIDVPDDPSIIDINSIENQMRNLSIGFNLKWLDINVLPRKTVFEIQRDVQQKILKPFEEVVNTMQIAGLLSVEGQRIFARMFEMFEGMDTEYKFMESLKSADLYVVPREFVISNELRPGIVNNEQRMDSDPITGKYKKIC